MNAVAMSNPTAQGAPVPVLLRGRVEAMVEAGFPLTRIATESGVRKRDLEGWIEGREVDGADERMAAWFAELAAEEELAPPGFVETPTARRILSALEMARSERRIVLVYGSAGVGKSQAAGHYRDGHRRTGWGTMGLAERVINTVALVQASPANKTVTAILESLAEAIDSLGNAHTKQELARSIASRLDYGETHLIIVDEAQYLEADALDAMRFFNDDGRGVGIAYLGNTEVYTRIHGKGRAARFAHLSSRIAQRLKLECPTEGDVDAILQAWGVSGRKEREYAIDHVVMNKGLRELGTVLGKARELARDMGRPVDVRILRAAARTLGIWQG